MFNVIYCKPPESTGWFLAFNKPTKSMPFFRRQILDKENVFESEFAAHLKYDVIN